MAQAHAGIDCVVGLYAATAQSHHCQTNVAGLHGAEHAGTQCRHRQYHWRSGQIPCGFIQQVSRAAQGGNHAREMFGSGTAVQRSLQPRRGFGCVASQSAQDQKLGT